MSLEEIKNQLPEVAKDIKLNLSSLLKDDPTLDISYKQALGTALACAFSVKSNALVEALLGEAKDVLEEKDIEAAKGAAVMMAMNNIYYRFLHLTSDSEFKKMPAGLRMNFIKSHGVEASDFELYSLAVSAINGCGMCVDAHVNNLVKEGVSKKGIQTSIRIASVIHAAGQALEI